MIRCDRTSLFDRFVQFHRSFFLSDHSFVRDAHCDPPVVIVISHEFVRFDFSLVRLFVVCDAHCDFSF